MIISILIVAALISLLLFNEERCSVRGEEEKESSILLFSLSFPFLSSFPICFFARDDIANEARSLHTHQSVDVSVSKAHQCFQ